MLLRTNRSKPREGECGQSVIEAALLTPWIFLLFLGIVDLGFFGYAMVSVENAARVAALFGSEEPGTPVDKMCHPVADELSMLPNIGAAFGGDCQSSPLHLAFDPVEPADSADGEPAVRATVTYESIPLFPIPGLTGRLTITRMVEARIED